MQNKWTFQEATAAFELPFFSLIYKAHTIHKENFDPQKIQVSTLLSIQTGGCSEDCAYCAQSIKNGTKMPKQAITDIDTIVQAATEAKKNKSSRFCMGLSGRTQDNQTFEYVCKVIKAVKSIGIQTCLTAGFVNEEQAKLLKESGLDYYNHNLDTSKDFYTQVISTRNFDDRIKTIEILQKAGINICAGGIIGMGENNQDRVKMLVALANLQPNSVPINKLVKFCGGKLENEKDVNEFDFIRIIALARIMMPKAYVRLSAGREGMSDTMQALCFFAGANSVFCGDKLLTVDNVPICKDIQLFNNLNVQFEVGD